ncbi:hypothetical protein [Paenibacillus sp. FJAT-27812]|uniref:hypothetical protein n=1 Tax=Paenibacillus sp. FJAT-27812 TaxID=1684143 RepID=UPI0006A7A99A|nr:hypothetical protein [Paenibacillus sp. FJAT-27812]
MYGTELEKAGPVGDWLAGSTVPFFTFATFITAYMAYSNQKKELAHSRDIISQQTRSIEIQRFENTLFILLNEMQKHHDQVVLEYKKSPIIPIEHMYSEALESMRSSLRITLLKQASIRKRIDYLIQGHRINEERREYEFYIRIRRNYVNKFKNHALFNSVYLEHLANYLINIFDLMERYNLTSEEYKYYTGLFSIYLSEEALLLAIYYSLIRYGSDNLFLYMFKYKIFDKLKSNKAINSQFDYTLFISLANFLTKTRLA